MEPALRHLSLHAASAPSQVGAGAVALCAALTLPEDGKAPEWVHLLPTGEIRTIDGRGPYRVTDAAAVIAESLQSISGAVIDENHATDLAAPRGEAAPARAWIREFEARADGIWGKVDWTAAGARLVTSKAYRGLSPVIEYMPDGRVVAIRRASLVNRPNLRGLTALHSEEPTMTLLEKLAAALGLPAATTEEAAIAAVTTMHAARAETSTALQAALAPIAKAVGLAETADARAVLVGVQGVAAAAGQGTDQVVTALQAELATVTTQLNGLLGEGKKRAAETFVDAAIREGRVGVKPMRERYVAMHQVDPANVEALIAAMPVLGGGGQIVPATPPAANGEISLNAAEAQAAKLLGIDPKAMAATLKAEREAAL